MKKFFIMMAALFTLTVAHAQTEPTSVKIEGPTLVDDFLTNFVVTLGISPDGTYVYGSIGGDNPFGICNVVTNDPIWILEPELGEVSTGIQIAGITNDGIAFVSENNVSYMLNLKDSTRVYLESPEPEVGMDIWDVTSDGKYFVGNVTDVDGFYCKPLYAERQEDGTYKMVLLEVPELDAMGCVPQFSQSRFVSSDGKYVVGLQPDSRGFAPRMLFWEKQDDGTFKLSTPLDKVIYDLSVPQPGELPEYEDIVTADPELDPDLFNEQYELFSETYEKCDSLYSAFIKGQSLRTFGMNMGLRDPIVFTGVDKMSESDLMFAIPDTHPIYFNCETKEIMYDSLALGNAFEQLPGGGYIKYDDSSMMFYKSVAVTEDGKEIEFTEWLKDLTGVDISDNFFYAAENPLTGEEYTDVFCGITYFSEDGKTLALYGYDEDMNNVTYIVTFNCDLYSIPSDIKQVQILTASGYRNNTLLVKGGEDANVVLYGTNGVKYGEYNFAGSINLKNVVPAGSYIAKIKTAGGETTMKVVVK